MAEQNKVYAVDEMLEPGLRYTEEVGQIVRSLPVRYCSLWRDGEEEPVSSLELLSFRQRFGSVALSAEGIGGAETPPPFRRQGYMRRLLTRAAAGMAQRVDVAFVSDGIEGMYEKVGYVTCLAEGHLTLKIRHLDPMLEQIDDAFSGRRVRAFTPNDLPGMVRLYNTTHAQRPWTHDRHAGWNQLIPTEIWRPGSTALVLAEGDQVVGYMIYKERFYGWPDNTFAIDELAAQDLDAARCLLAEIARQSWQLRFSEFTVAEPLDSLVGQVARRLGCEYTLRYPPSGGMMGAVLHREALLSALEPELRRRLPGDMVAAEHAVAFRALIEGELLPDDAVLLRLLLGYWSTVDAQAAGSEIPAPHARVCAAWFPGGGTPNLLQPYAHKLDRY